MATLSQDNQVLKVQTETNQGVPQFSVGPLLRETFATWQQNEILSHSSKLRIFVKKNTPKSPNLQELFPEIAIFRQWVPAP
jgi:hypothetical protein